MFLKRIELFGFKSFVDKTVIELKGNIIAILGPNGCGKSNIADAVKWVMGEQSGKALRVEKMEDLIFGGSESRRALNVAEISLTFENDLPDFAFSEISVKRRIFRNGESEYFVNNVPVKLRNMKEQLFDIGIGKSAYSIIEQGKVDQILSSRAEDRRYIFEEAAGISRHRNKWKEASKKLEQVDTNINHIESVLSEVKRSYNNLKKQAEKAEEYRSLKNTVFELERNRYLLRLRKYQEQRDRKEREIRHTGAAREDVQQEIDHINKYLETNLDQVRHMEGTLNDAHRQLYGMSIEKKNLQSQKSALAERMQDIEERIRQDKDGEEGLQQLNDVLKKENDETAVHIQECGGRLTGLDDNIRDFEDQVKSAQNRIDENSREETRIVKETRSLEKQLVELQEDLQKLTDDIVRELDEQLKTANPASREDASEHLNTLLAQQAQLIKRYRQRLADLPNASEKELRAFFEEFLREFESICRDMSAGVEEYRKNVPSFIEEFLAPGGII
ncbi:MAG: chromosome segregation protein SMC, partial [Salinispira sp.]